MNDEEIKAAAALAVDVAIGADAGDQVKMIAFIIDEFAIRPSGIIHNTGDIAALIAEALNQLAERGAK